MSGLYKRQLRSVVVPILETAQSTATADSSLLLAGPVDVYAVFMHSGQNIEVSLFDTDHGAPVMHLGELPDTQVYRLICPGRTQFTSGVHMRLDVIDPNPSLQYTIFYRQL